MQDLDHLLRELRPRIQDQLRRYPLSDADPADVTQTTLLRIAERIGDFRGDARLSTWIFRITENQALMMMRANRRRAARWVVEANLEALADDPDPHTHEPAADTLFCRARRNARVRDVLEDLPRSQRKILLAHYEDGLELAEIARRTGASATTIRSRIHRARANLRTRIEALTPITPADLAA